MRGEQFVVAIVRADDIQHVGQAVIVIVAHVRTEQRLRDGPRRVVFVADLERGRAELSWPARLGRVVNFVADAVEDDARMVAVAADGVAGVRLRPLVEIEVIVVTGSCRRSSNRKIRP